MELKVNTKQNRKGKVVTLSINSGVKTRAQKLCTERKIPLSKQVNNLLDDWERKERFMEKAIIEYEKKVLEEEIKQRFEKKKWMN